MNDLISRQVVLEWIKESIEQYANTYSNDMLNMWKLFEEQIKALPSAENKGACKECKWYDKEQIYNAECENCSRSFNDNFRRSDMRKGET